MAIRKGEDWGAAGGLPADGVVADTDAAVRGLVETARRAGGEPPPVGLLGSTAPGGATDLCRTLGGRGDAAYLHRPNATRVKVDVARVELDGETHWFVAHLAAHEPWWRGGWWRGRTAVVMNAAWLGRWNMGPRAHPGDGLLDLLDADLGLGDRLKARRRLPLGTHVPHPDIRMRRSASVSLTLDRPLMVWLDGQRIGRFRSIAVQVEPEALTVVV
jgi:diacylglycerol kinase family enzyme